MDITLRPIRADELDLLHGFSQDPAVSGHLWAGFRPVSGLAREHAENGFLGEDTGRLMVEADGAATGFVSYRKGRCGVQGDWFEIGCEGVRWPAVSATRRRREPPAVSLPAT